MIHNLLATLALLLSFSMESGIPPQQQDERYVQYCEKLKEFHPDFWEEMMGKLMDPSFLDTKMNNVELSEFFGTVSATQLKLLFNACKIETMTPLEFGDFLVNQLMDLKVFQPFINKKEKEEARLVNEIMMYCKEKVGDSN